MISNSLEILNKLIEPLSYKTMAFFILFLFGSLYLIQSGLFRTRRSYPQQGYQGWAVPHQPMIYQPCFTQQQQPILIQHPSQQNVEQD